MSDISDQRCYYERMMDEIAAEHRKQLEQLRDENTKLRELVRAAFHCQFLRCYECPMASPCDTSIGGVPECRFERVANALGVEDDE